VPDQGVVERGLGNRLRRLVPTAPAGDLPDPSPRPTSELEPVEVPWLLRRVTALVPRANARRRIPARTGTERGPAAAPSPSPPPVAERILRRQGTDWRRREPDTTSPAPARTRVRIDPRFRQRRIQVKREEGRRRLRVLVAGTSVLVTVAAAFVALRSPLLSVRHVVVRGAQHTAVADVLAAAHLTGHPLMIGIAPARDDRAVQRLPWVARASIHRHWPDAVVVDVVERTPVASVGDGLLVDASGRVLGAAPPSTALPAVTLAGGRAAAVPAAGATLPPAYRPGLVVASALPAPLVPKVVAVLVAPDGTVRLGLAGGAGAILGDTGELSSKLEAVLTLVERVRIGSGTIDATVPTAPVLTQGP
jgi:cell division protein FtsQ